MRLWPTLIIAGGGTGGHVFPGIALAEAFLSLCPGGAVSFVGTREGLEARIVPGRGFEIDFVPSGQVRGKGARALLGAAAMTRGMWTARAVLKKRRPDLVFGVGGYASVPMALAASLSRIPLFLQEQNAVPGRANRMLGRMARRVYAGFRGAASYFPAGKADVAGNPVRAEIVAAARDAAGRTPAPPPFVVFALGGSQGAQAINRTVLSTARRVKREGRAVRFLHQTGSREFAEVERAVRDEGLPVEPFPFTDRIADPFARCHAVLMRAGALSIAEAAVFGKPCLLLPYPFAADRHQEKNAEEFCAAGAGVWMREQEAAAERMGDVLFAWAEDPAARDKAARAAASFARPGAAVAIVRSALRELGIRDEAARV